ncbi:hypothetical protein EAG_06310 [Camponotus floridanus]|uniref:Uncharacterized protein n=1 Tax=Camponotus floridanus TaxID=104421 RepID=E2AHK8_CAMFO|nr:hypothetical protein EAG_06310 [Camponotus floridanus]
MELPTQGQSNLPIEDDCGPFAMERYEEEAEDSDNETDPEQLLNEWLGELDSLTVEFAEKAKLRNCWQLTYLKTLQNASEESSSFELQFLDCMCYRQQEVSCLNSGNAGCNFNILVIKHDKLHIIMETDNSSKGYNILVHNMIHLIEVAEHCTCLRAAVQLDRPSSRLPTLVRRKTILISASPLGASVFVGSSLGVRRTVINAAHQLHRKMKIFKYSYPSMKIFKYSYPSKSNSQILDIKEYFTQELMHISAFKDLLCNLVLFFDIVRVSIEKSLSTGTRQLNLKCFEPFLTMWDKYEPDFFTTLKYLYLHIPLEPSTLGSHCDSEPAEIPLITSIEQAEDRWKGVLAPPGRVEQQQQDNHGSRVLQLCRVLGDKSGSDLAKGGTKGKKRKRRIATADLSRGSEGNRGCSGEGRYPTSPRAQFDRDRALVEELETKIVPLVAR